MEGTMMQSSPSSQLTGVATLWLSVNCSESMTRRISLKLRPVLAGYVSVRRTFLFGSMMNTERTVAVVLALGWIMSYKVDTLRSSSARMGYSTLVFWVSLMSSIHLRCDSASSTDTAITLALRLANSPDTIAV